MSKIFRGLIALSLTINSYTNLFSQNTIDQGIPKDNPSEIIKLAEKSGQKPDRIIQLANLALTKLSKTDKNDLEAKAYQLIGKAYYQKGQMNSALEYYKRSEQLYIQQNDSINLAEAMNRIGDCYMMKSQYTQSLEYLQEALKISERSNDKRLNASILNNLGIVYQLTNQLDQSLACLIRALQLFEGTGNKIGISSTQNNLGLTYNLQGKYNEALSWFNKAISTKKELMDTLNLANTYESIGQVYEKLETFSKAIEYYAESLRFQVLLNNSNGIAAVYTSLARIYIKTNNYQKAYDNLTMSEEIAHRVENYVVIKENKKLLSEYYLAVGNPYQSREMMKQYALIVEKLFSKQVSDRMAEMTVQYETEQKEYQNKLLQANLEIEKYKLQRSNDIQIFFITLSLLVIGLLIYMLLLLKRLNRKNKQIEQFNYELNKLNLELEEKVEIRTKELSEALVRAEQSDRLKSAFLANMSHEIRTPMNGILGFTRILENDNVSAEDRVLYLDMINRQGRNLLQIINDIINLSKLETGQMEVKNTICNVNKIFDDLYLMFNSPGYFNKKREVELKAVKPLSDDECNIVADIIRVEQILINLIDNALKFTYNGEVVFGYKIEQPNSMKFYVSDTGIGIPKDQLERIFDRFYRYTQGQQSTHSGAGLGLSISKKLANLIGGELFVESVPNKGSAFYLTIPYVPVEFNESQIDAKCKGANKEYYWPNRVALVVEDDNFSYQYIETLLAAAGVKVIHAMNGEEAVVICSSSRSIDFVLMDIQLPFMSGYEATMQIKSIRKNLPIIAQTANVLNDERNRSLEAGCNFYISKPIDPDELYAIISKCLENQVD